MDTSADHAAETPRHAVPHAAERPRAAASGAPHRPRSPSTAHEPRRAPGLLHRHHASASAASRARWPASSGTTCPADGYDFGKGRSLDHTGSLSASTWRHVHFVEIAPPQRAGAERRAPRSARAPAASCRTSRPPARRAARRRPRPGRDGRRRRAARGGHGPLAVRLRRLQALHERRLPGRLPDRRADPHRVRDGDRAARHLQRLRLLRPACPFGVIDRDPVRRARRQVHALLRPPAGRPGAGLREGVPDRLDPVRPLRRARRAREGARASSCTSAGSRRRTSTARATRAPTSSPAAWARSSCSPSRPSASGCPPRPTHRSRPTCRSRPPPGWPRA